MSTASTTFARTERRRLLLPAAVGALAVLFIGAPTVAQESSALADDGWDYSETNSIHLASVSYDGGRGIVVRCSRGNLAVVLMGLPHPHASKVETRGVGFSLNGAAPEQQTWLALPRQTELLSGRPAYAARSLRAGGSASFHIQNQGAPPLRFDLPLPTNGEAIDRVLDACDIPLHDSRDAIQEFRDLAEGSGPRLWARVPRLENIPVTLRYDFVVVSCVTGDAGRLTDCRSEMQAPFGGDVGARVARVFETGRLSPAAGIPEGQIIVVLLTHGR